MGNHANSERHKATKSFTKPTTQHANENGKYSYVIDSIPKHFSI
jgi:hypothetical protein